MVRFDGGKVKEPNKKTGKAKKDTIPTHFKTLELLKENHSIEWVAEKRELSVGTMIVQGRSPLIISQSAYFLSNLVYNAWAPSPIHVGDAVTLTAKGI